MSDAQPPLAVLRRLRGAPNAAVRPDGLCELCSQPIAETHGHVVDIASRGLLCACRGCYLLFTPEGAGGKRYRAVPDRYLALTDLHVGRADWDAFQIPVSVAFVFVNSALGRAVAFYPGPAGATESLLPMARWDGLVAAHPVLATLQPDVEALLVHAPRDREQECFVVPIDVCYELVGRLRRVWRGFDGGAEAHAALEAYFARIREAAR